MEINLWARINEVKIAKVRTNKRSDERANQLKFEFQTNGVWMGLK